MPFCEYPNTIPASETYGSILFEHIVRPSTPYYLYPLVGISPFEAKSLRSKNRNHKPQACEVVALKAPRL